MRIHVYDYLNNNKLGVFGADKFTGLSVSQTIDDFFTARLSYSISGFNEDVQFRGFENVYIEDDFGNIIFGGVMVSITGDQTGGTMTCYDHRWVLTRLVVDSALQISSSEDILDTVESLINMAKAKRLIPFEFDRENSAINPDFSADLQFEVGDNIGACMQKIIQTTYARWALRYRFVNDNIVGGLIVRSVVGVNPEGVGISRSLQKSEDGKVISLFYNEGGEGNLQDFKFNFDLSNYSSKTKMAIKVNNNPLFLDIPPLGNSEFFQNLWGVTEEFVSDYKVDSVNTAFLVGSINQTPPRQTLEATLAPNFNTFLNCGDRVNVKIVSSALAGIFNTAVRIDRLDYVLKDGYLERSLYLNFIGSQKRSGTTGILEKINKIDSNLDELNKNYLNS